MQAAMGGELERTVEEMRGRFFAVSEEIARQLSWLASRAAGAPPQVQNHILEIALQIASAQERLRDETNRLPLASDQRFAIMQSVLQAQQGAHQQLAAIVAQYAPSSGHQHLPGTGNGLARLGALPATPPGRMQSGSDHIYAAATGYDEATEDAYPTDVDDDGSPPRRLPRALQKMRAGRSSGSRGSRRSNGPNITLVARARARAAAVLSGVTSRQLALVAAAVAALAFAYVTFPIQGQSGVAPRRIDNPNRVVIDSSPPMKMTLAEQPSSAIPVSPDPFQREPKLAFNVPPPIPAPPVQPVGQADAATPPLTADPSSPTSNKPEQIDQFVPRSAAVLNTAPAEPAPESFVPVVFTHKDHSTAQQAFADLRQQYPTLLARRTGEVQAINVAEKGVWHRLVLLPSGSRRQATSLCERLLAAGYDRCWVKPY